VPHLDSALRAEFHRGTALAHGLDRFLADESALQTLHCDHTWVVLDTQVSAETE
jgi:hypothetical protein